MSILVSRPPSELSDSFVSFPSNSASSTSGIFGRVDDSVAVPISSLRQTVNYEGLSKTVFLAFKSLHEILGAGEVRTTDGSADAFDWEINSRIISASLAKGRHLEMLGHPAQLTFRHLKAVETDDDDVATKCMFWNYEMSVWSDDGCKLAERNETHSLCECGHLTNFALFTRRPSKIAPLNNQVSNNEISVRKTSENDDAATTFVLQIVAFVILGFVLIGLVIVLFKVRNEDKGIHS